MPRPTGWWHSGKCWCGQMLPAKAIVCDCGWNFKHNKYTHPPRDIEREGQDKEREGQDKERKTGPFTDTSVGGRLQAWEVRPGSWRSPWPKGKGKGKGEVGKASDKEKESDKDKEKESQ